MHKNRFIAVITAFLRLVSPSYREKYQKIQILKILSNIHNAVYTFEQELFTEHKKVILTAMKDIYEV